MKSKQAIQGDAVGVDIPLCCYWGQLTLGCYRPFCVVVLLLVFLLIIVVLVC